MSDKTSDQNPHYLDRFVREIPHQDQVRLSFPDELGYQTLELAAFNTIVSIRFIGGSSWQGSQLAAELIALCRKYEQLFSAYLIGSDVYRINEAPGTRVAVDPETHELIKCALEYCALSEGTFDITMGAVTRLWDFVAQEIPSQAEVDEALAFVDWQAVELFDDGTVQIKPGFSLDLGGVAKGYIADKIEELLRKSGQTSAIINLGGNVICLGVKHEVFANKDLPWMVGITDPHTKDRDDVLGALVATDQSVVTSGINERGFWCDDTYYHHILSCKTGMPVSTDIASVTVVSKRSIDGDGWSTALLALGFERSRELVEKHPEIEALWVLNDGSIHMSEGCPEYIARPA